MTMPIDSYCTFNTNVGIAGALLRGGRVFITRKHISPKSSPVLIALKQTIRYSQRTFAKTVFEYSSVFVDSHMNLVVLDKL